MYDADSIEALREELATEDLSAKDLRERRNVITIWETINPGLGLLKHALQLYDDVELSSP